MYQITDWSDHFENNRTREAKTMVWVPIPTKMDGDGFTELMDHPNGAAHYGAWIACVHVAAKSQPRGSLLRSNGTPHDIASLSRITRVTRGVLEEAIPRLLKIKWLEKVSPEDGSGIDDTESRSESAGIPHESDDKLRSEADAVVSCLVKDRGCGGKESKDRIETLQAAWNSTPSLAALPGLIGFRAITTKRKVAFAARFRDSFWAEHWREALLRVAASEFCNGGGSQGWRADIDWFLAPDSVAKIIEGKYDQRPTAGRSLLDDDPLPKSTTPQNYV